MPHFPTEFEIPDDWLEEAGFKDFKPTKSAFRSTPTASILQLAEIEPPIRFRQCPKDGSGFHRERLVRILNGIISDEIIEPVPVFELPAIDLPRSPYLFRVCDGFHRFYASIAAGFGALPVDL